jgi:hypothetical protein
MLSQISGFVFGFNVRIFDDKIETKSLIRCDDNLLIHDEMKAITNRKRRHISFTECGQTLQLRLAMVYMYAEDII